MRKAIGHLITGTWMFCLLWALASCSREAAEDPDVPSGGEMTLNIGFKIPTRATADGYEDGETHESYIDIAGGNYRIYFFDTDNKFIAGFAPSGFITADGSDYHQYNVLGKAPDALVEHTTFKMVVLANWPEYPESANTPPTAGVTTITDICDASWAQYACLTDGNETNPTAVALDPDADRLMPFYGVHEYSNVTFKPGVATILSDPVTMLRAMAKVEVILDTDDDISITKAKVTGYNKKGYCAPADVFSQSDYGQGNDWQTDYLSELHLINNQNDENATTRSLSLRKREKDSETKWIAYLPEYRNRSVKDKYARLELKFSFQEDSDSPYLIYFAEYDENGKTDNSQEDLRLDIERNNIYRFKVKVSPLLLQVLVEKWEFGGKVHIDM